MSFWMAQMQFFNQKNYIYAILGEHQENTRRCSTIPLNNNIIGLFYYNIILIGGTVLESSGQRSEMITSVPSADHRGQLMA
jgi:hypothetical protein